MKVGSGTTTQRIAAVMTVHNRRDKTIACLERLRSQQGVDADIDAYVVDDGSTDGTAAAIATRFADVTVLDGDGGLFWNAGMRLGLAAAYRGRYDAYLWLNDDTVLDDDALTRMLDTWRVVSDQRQRPCIVVGSTRDPSTGTVTYGGRFRPSRIRRTAFHVLPPAATVPRPTETMNGNAVLVPAAVVERIGNLEARYRHKWGDEDYGLRARKAGCEVWLAPGLLGSCPRNVDTPIGTRPLLDELRALWSTKGLEPRSWALFTRRWAGPIWPLFFVSPYVRGTARILMARARRAALDRD